MGGYVTCCNDNASSSDSIFLPSFVHMLREGGGGRERDGEGGREEMCYTLRTHTHTHTHARPHTHTHTHTHLYGVRVNKLGQ